jgi:hypothetical protein
MVEPAGLVIGILGLAGLFNNTLDVLDKFDSWRDYESESGALMAQFKAHKFKLEKWGQAVGFEGENLLDEHDKLLDDPQIRSTVQDLLSAINYLCGPIVPRNSSESKRERISWALRKEKRIKKLEQFSSILDILYGLIPIKKEGSVVSSHWESTGGDSHSGHVNGTCWNASISNPI